MVGAVITSFVGIFSSEDSFEHSKQFIVEVETSETFVLMQSSEV